MMILGYAHKAHGTRLREHSTNVRPSTSQKAATSDASCMQYRDNSDCYITNEDP